MPVPSSVFSRKAEFVSKKQLYSENQETTDQLPCLLFTLSQGMV